MAKQSTPSTPAGRGQYVAYYRVSTRAQGDSGLGLQGQRAAVAGFLNGRTGAEFTEVESGSNNQRLSCQRLLIGQRKSVLFWSLPNLTG